MKALPIAVISIVVASIIAGFFLIGSPMTQRARRFDERRVSDLQAIQWEIINYWQKKGVLPASLSMLRDDIRGFVPPQDPETAMGYEYAPTGASAFSVCAVFTMTSDVAGVVDVSRPMPAGIENDNWAHGAGRTCFKRTIDKDLYPSVPMKPMPVIQ